MEMVSCNGKTIALPNITVTTDGVHILNVQKQWLDQYGLPVLKTLDDIENVIPMLVAYPFLRRYFISGIMPGAVKE
jgi:multiple sugar transport system substrate-binding protein/putative aldouronate transport system substrate-binding protein